MKGISTQNLKAFTKRFGYQRKGSKGIVPISVEQAEKALDNFITLSGAKNLKPSFVNTRKKVLQICFEENSATNRWVKIKDYLLKRLVSQAAAFYTKKYDLKDVVKPSNIMSCLMDTNSYISQCIKTLVLFNITDEDAKLPRETIIDFGSSIEYSFPDHQIKHQVIILKAITESGVNTERIIQASDENLSNFFGEMSKSKYASVYSYLSDEKSNVHIIKMEEFFIYIREKYPDFIKPFKLTSDMKPSILFRAFNEKLQKKILNDYIKKSIEKWKWELENMCVVELSKIVDEYFSDLEARIVSIKPVYPVIWEPVDRIFDVDVLRYELIDKFLQKFPLHTRIELLTPYFQEISIFNLKTFRDLLNKWTINKEFNNISSILAIINSNYIDCKDETKQRRRIIEYVKISNLIQQKMKRMIAYKIASPNEITNTVEQRYLRQKHKLKEEGYKVDNPDHISVLMKDWNITELELNF